MQKTSDINVVETRPLPSPAALLAELPKTESQADFITQARAEIRDILRGKDRRFLLIVGPCSIHDRAAGREYASRLAQLARDAGLKLPA